MKRNLLSSVISVFIIFSLVFVLSCSKEEPTSPGFTAQEIINNSIEKMTEISSFHFELSHEGGRTPIAMGLELEEAKGDMKKPDKLKTTVMAALRGILVEVQVITIGDTTYMTNPLTKKWEYVPGEFSAISIFDPNAGITSILQDVVNPTVVESEDGDKPNGYHITGEIPSESLRPITLSSAGGINVSAEIWIDTKSFLINQITIEGQISETEQPGIIRKLKLSNYNKEIEIVSPM
jgi:hypothetical protein